MIRSFANQASKDIYLGKNSKIARQICPRELHTAVRRKLILIDQMDSLRDLRIPGNDLKKIDDQYQIRINDQYRIRFLWEEDVAKRVEVGDFH